jgi:hypothetical protein
MRSDLPAKSADDSVSTEAAPHNAPLRIIGAADEDPVGSIDGAMVFRKQDS